MGAAVSTTHSTYWLQHCCWRSPYFSRFPQSRMTYHQHNFLCLISSMCVCVCVRAPVQEDRLGYAVVQ